MFEKEKMLVASIFSFSHNLGLCGNGLKKKASENFVGKKDVENQQFLLKTLSQTSPCFYMSAVPVF